MIHKTTEMFDPAQVLADLGWEEHEMHEWRLDCIAEMFDRKVKPLLDKMAELERQLEEALKLKPKWNAKLSICTVEGCGRPGYSRGMCSRHYNRRNREERKARHEKMSAIQSNHTLAEASPNPSGDRYGEGGNQPAAQRDREAAREGAGDHGGPGGRVSHSGGGGAALGHPSGRQAPGSRQAARTSQGDGGEPGRQEGSGEAGQGQEDPQGQEGGEGGERVANWRAGGRTSKPPGASPGVRARGLKRPEHPGDHRPENEAQRTQIKERRMA